jgi:hypothetical protein
MFTDRITAEAIALRPGAFFGNRLSQYAHLEGIPSHVRSRYFLKAMHSK